MIKAIAFLVLLFSSAFAAASSMRGAAEKDTLQTRELTSCDLGKKCALYDLHTDQRIKTLDGDYEKRYKLPPPDQFHKGYSIKCDYDQYQVDTLKWSYPDGKKITSRYENSFPWWLNGDKHGVAAKADWLSKPGYKYIKLEAYKNGYVCYSKTFQLDAYCLSGYYDWDGHCYKWTDY